MIGYSFRWRVGILLSQRKYQSLWILSRMRNSSFKSISSQMIRKIICRMMPVTKAMTMKYRIYIRTSKDSNNSSSNHLHYQHKMEWEILKEICRIQITWTTTITTEVLELAILLLLCRCSSSNNSSSINSSNSSNNRIWITIRINSSQCINSSNSNTTKMERSLSKQQDKLDRRKFQTKRERKKKEIVISSETERQRNRKKVRIKGVCGRYYCHDY